MAEGLFNPLAALQQMRLLGGPIVDWIFVACVVMWAIVIERYAWFRFTLPRETGRALERWRARGERQSWGARQIRQAMISRLNSGMSSNLQMLKVIVPLCPLLGLLGTVAGMLDVFDSMAARGSADARTMANGVSEAMICTLTGLAVSITGLYPVYYFQRRVRAETERLAETFAY